MKKELNIVIAGAALWCAGVVAAPFLHGTLLSESLYRMYSVVCHQFDSRSFHLHGAPLAVCIRCSSIYSVFLMTLILLRIVTPLRDKKIAPLRLLVITAFPMAVDGILSVSGLYQATDVSRVLTGSLFGIGIALLLHHSLAGSIRSLFFTKNPIR
ncbi:MAG: DUF2085 domain-containing protein [Bacteroidetes bacterium]|nr:DUF2085 domain-containing protein [Bacteroidota bacterium]